MIRTKSYVTIKATLDLDEDQLRALDALVGYGIKPFLEVFYEHMGQSYLKPHEKGLRELFAKVQETASPAIAEVDKVRRELQMALEDKLEKRN